MKHGKTLKENSWYWTRVLSGEQKKMDDHLFEAVRNDDVGAIVSLVKQGADIESKSPVPGKTLLVYAIDYLHPATTVEAILKAGADPTRKNLIGWTALSHAKGRNDQDIISLVERYTNNWVYGAPVEPAHIGLKVG